MKTITIFLIDFYRIFLSLDRGMLSLLVPGGACRYSPTCSMYTRNSIFRYGVVKGLILGTRRFLSCR